MNEQGVTDTRMKELAELGAIQRLVEIRNEAEELLAQFPRLRGSVGKLANGSTTPERVLAETPETTTTEDEPAIIRKRRPMSAAQRKAVSKRMKASWARRKALA